MTRFLFQIECSNGQVGYGRRRREASPSSPESGSSSGRNRIYEVNMSTIVKVAFEPVDAEKPQLWVEKGINRLFR